MSCSVIPRSDSVEPYRNYRPQKEHGVIVWYRIMPKHVVGIHPDHKKPIRIAKSGHREAILRVPTNTDDYSKACEMLDRKLTRPKKEPEYKVPPNQTKMFQ